MFGPTSDLYGLLHRGTRVRKMHSSYRQMYVYDTGRDLLDIGVVPLGNMLPEVAHMKLGWALGQSQDNDEVRRIMTTPVADETTEREPFNGYIVLQGGIPELDEFLSRGYR